MDTEITTTLEQDWLEEESCLGLPADEETVLTVTDMAAGMIIKVEPKWLEEESCLGLPDDDEHVLPVDAGVTIKLEQDLLEEKSCVGLPADFASEETETGATTLHSSHGIKVESDPLKYSVKKEEPFGPDFEFADVENVAPASPEINQGPPFSCKTCNHSFSREIALQRHVGQCLKPACKCCDGPQQGSCDGSEQVSCDGSKEDSDDEMLEESSTPPQQVELKVKKKKNVPVGKGELCPECGVMFAVGNLARHMLRHSGERPFVCELCNVRFTQSNDLAKHIRIHTGERPLVCKTCGATFSENYCLTRHQRSHFNHKPHGCDTCGARFKEKYSLTVHLRIHTGEKPYACLKCPARFAEKGNLTKHNMVQHNIMPKKMEICECQVCGKKCPNKGSLTKHSRKHLKPISQH